MAIVLVIVTILIGGLAVPLSAQIQARRIAETNRTLDEVRDAILGHAMSHTTGSCTCAYTSGTLESSPTTTCPTNLCPTSVTGTATLTIGPRHFLPCPDKLDDGNPLTTDDGDGVADKTGSGPTATCVKPYGYLPWATLGVGNQDAWGNRLRYSVTDAFSRSAGFSNSDEGDLTVCSSSLNAGASDCAPGNVADKIPVVILSQGPNGWGALNISGTTQAPLGGIGEKENVNIDTEFVNSLPYKPANGSAAEQAKEFDDLVRWISADQIRGRVCPSGGCP
jgi:type II secretory pathway pseudopilin PulG